jgi:hypothetical protein
MEDSEDKTDKYLATEPKEINGWKLSSWFGDARAGRTDLSCDPPVLAKDRAAFRPAAGRRELAAGGGSAHRAVNLLSHDTRLWSS